MESDVDYYLLKQELILLFRQFMTRKRLNSKDYSYENFTLKNPRDSGQQVFDNISR
jgi:hypothetical protein